MTTFGRDDMFIAFGLVAVTLAVYAQVMSHQFIILGEIAISVRTQS